MLRIGRRVHVNCVLTLPAASVRCVDAPSRCTRVRPILSVSLVFAFVACGDDGRRAPETRHPDPRFIENSVRAIEIGLGDNPGRLPVQLAGGAIGTVGALDGPDYGVFGRVTGTAVRRDSAFVVVDGTANEVRVFAARGDLIDRFGRAGDGPGEFRTPVAMALADDGTIAVADFRRKLHFFAPAERGYQHVVTHQLAFGVRSMCFLGDQLVVNGRSMGDSLVLRVVGRDGNVISAFGELYKSPNAYANYELADGRVACDSESGLAIFGPSSVLGELRAYKLDGTLVWRTAVRDYLRNTFTDTAGEGWTITSSEAGIHELSGLVVIAGLGIVAQYGHLTSEELRARQGPKVVQTVLLKPSSGEWISSDSAWPIVGAVADGLALVTLGEPWPQVQLRGLRVDSSATLNWTGRAFR